MLAAMAAVSLVMLAATDRATAPRPRTGVFDNLHYVN